jgi:hypothetical protein
MLLTALGGVTLPAKKQADVIDPETLERFRAERRARKAAAWNKRHKG